MLKKFFFPVSLKEIHKFKNKRNVAIWCLFNCKNKYNFGHGNPQILFLWNLWLSVTSCETLKSVDYFSIPSHRQSFKVREFRLPCYLTHIIREKIWIQSFLKNNSDNWTLIRFADPIFRKDNHYLFIFKIT